MASGGQFAVFETARTTQPRHGLNNFDTGDAEGKVGHYHTKG